VQLLRLTVIRDHLAQKPSNQTGAEVLARVAKARVGYKTTKARSLKLFVEYLEKDPLPESPHTWACRGLAILATEPAERLLARLGDLNEAAARQHRRAPGRRVALAAE
jgi:hypothetical protein